MFKDVQTKLGLQPTELVQLSKTRWSCQLHSVSVMLENFPAVIQCISSLKNGTAVGLHVKLSQFSTVYMLTVLLSVTDNLQKYLQSV